MPADANSSSSRERDKDLRERSRSYQLPVEEGNLPSAGADQPTLNHLPVSPGSPLRRRHSQGSVNNEPISPSPTPTPADYPDEFFEANDDAVPILRHPYYNELTEDLGTAAETLLEEQDQQEYSDVIEDQAEAMAASSVTCSTEQVSLSTTVSTGSHLSGASGPQADSVAFENGLVNGRRIGGGLEMGLESGLSTTGSSIPLVAVDLRETENGSFPYPGPDSGTGNVFASGNAMHGKQQQQQPASVPLQSSMDYPPGSLITLLSGSSTSGTLTDGVIFDNGQPLQFAGTGFAGGGVAPHHHAHAHAHHHYHHNHHFASAGPRQSVDQYAEAIEEEEDPDNTCWINYGLFKRYLENLLRTEASTQDPGQPDRFAFYSAKTGFVRSSSLLDISTNLVSVMQSGAFWLDMCAPSALELKVFGEVFKLHPLTLEDMQLDDVREKCDLFENYFCVSLKAYETPAKQQPGQTTRIDYSAPVNLYVVVAGRACVVSLHHQPLRFSQTIAKRIRLLSARTGLSTDWIAYGILDDVIDSFSPAIYECECEVELIDDACMQPGVGREAVPPGGTPAEGVTAEPAMFQRITACRKTLTCLQRLIASKSEAVRNVVKRCGSRLSEDALVYLRDLQDHVHMMEQTLGHQDDGLNRAYSNFLAHISIETAHTSNRMSRVMKTLSAFAAVTTPCTVVSCLLSMNLRGPFWPYGEHVEPSPHDYYKVVSFIVAATFLIVYLGRRYDWF